LRILQIAPFYPPHVGGIEYHVEALSKKLVEAGHQVTVYTSNVPRLAKHQTVSGVDIHRFNCLCMPLNNPIAPGVLPKLLAKNEFDVVHVHGHLHMFGNVAAVSNKFRRRPMVLTSHGAVLDLRGWRRPVEMLYHRTVGKWTLRSAHRIIALSSAQKEVLQRLGANPAVIGVVPHWVDLGQAKMQADPEAFRSTYGFGNRGILLVVGRLLPVKGIEYLIEALKYTQTRPALAIVGDEAPGYSGTRRALEQQVADLGLQKDVSFLGYFPKEALAAAYTAADLFVLPSIAEGLPLVLLEAMAYGKCVVATDIPGNSDVVTDGRNGILVEPRNARQLAEKIDSLLGDDKTRGKLGAQARQDIEQDYNPAVIFAKVLEIYREVARS
jgi:glycosyltransferase involved in cell wall biosynthesis